MKTEFLIAFVFLLPVVTSFNVKVSQACYGAPGVPCTTHSLRCTGEKIAILDAFYSNHSNCTGDKSNCVYFDVDKKYTNRSSELNETYTNELYGNCSFEESCDFNAPRQPPSYFSVVRYRCIRETRNICDGNAIAGHNKSCLWNMTSSMNGKYTYSIRISSKNTEPTAVYALDLRPRSACPNLSITAHGETYKNCTQTIQYQLLANTTWTIILKPVDVFDILWIYIRGHFEVDCSTAITPTSTTLSTTSTTAHNIGAIAGGVTSVLVVVTIVAAVAIVWFKFMRNKKKDKKPEKENRNHVFAGSMTRTAIQEVGSRNSKAVSNYDYATVQDGANPVGHAQNHYALVGKPSTNKVTTVLEEDDYNHINHNPPQSDSSPGYDTTVSAAVGVKKLNNASCYSVDDDDYNHLGDGKPSVVSSDYDTTVSASKVVAQLSEMKNSEDDYDHFKKNEDRVIDSPYDTANHHSSVSSDMTPNPYDLEI